MQLYRLDPRPYASEVLVPRDNRVTQGMYCGEERRQSNHTGPKEPACFISTRTSVEL